MKRTAPADALPTMFNEDDFRHPMWKKPDWTESLNRHVLALRTEIAKRLTPFDGRPNSEQVIMWLAEVYDESIHRKAEDPIWLLGDMTWRCHIVCSALSTRAEAEKRPDKRAQLVSQREAIKRIHQGLVEAVITSQDVR